MARVQPTPAFSEHDLANVFEIPAVPELNDGITGR